MCIGCCALRGRSLITVPVHIGFKWWLWRPAIRLASGRPSCLNGLGMLMLSRSFLPSFCHRWCFTWCRVHALSLDAERCNYRHSIIWFLFGRMHKSEVCFYSNCVAQLLLLGECFGHRVVGMLRISVIIMSSFSSSSSSLLSTSSSVFCHHYRHVVISHVQQLLWLKLSGCVRISKLQLSLLIYWLLCETCTDVFS